MIDTNSYIPQTYHIRCHNPNLGLVTGAKVCKGANQEWNLRITFHAPGSVGECEGMNLTFSSELELLLFKKFKQKIIEYFFLQYDMDLWKNAHD